jgi:hypothetical protein
MGEARGLVVISKGSDIPTVAVDVDLTLIDEKERLLPGAKSALTFLRETGWKIILWTCRTDLDHVKGLLTKQGVPFDHINANPEGDKGEFSRKILFHATVDDKAVPFDGDWTKAISDLEHRRTLWMLEGETKATVKIMVADREGKSKALAVFGIEGGKAIEKTGACDSLTKELIERGVSGDRGFVHPNSGLEFLKALIASVQGTYLWAEVS